MHVISQEELFSYDDILRYAINLYKNFNPIVRFTSIGQSHDTREIFMLEIGFGRKSLICTSGVHGRENINPMVLLEMAAYYAKAYETGKKADNLYIRELLDEYSICFIPLVNPDGYEIARAGFSVLGSIQLRNKCIDKKIPHEQWKCNARGIDINRNFKCESFIPNRYMLFPCSENETKALVKVFKRKSSIGYIDFHSRGNSIFYYRHNMMDEYNELQYEYAKRLCKISGYTLEKPESELDNGAGGNTVHYYSEYIGRPAITVETIDENAGFPLDIGYLKEVYERIHLIPLVYMAYRRDMNERIQENDNVQFGTN